MFRVRRTKDRPPQIPHPHEGEVMSTARQIAGARRSKKYKALVAPPLNLGDVAALAILGLAVESAPEATLVPAPEVYPRVTRLVESGAFSQAEAEEAVRAMDGTPADVPASEEPAEKPSGGDIE